MELKVTLDKTKEDIGSGNKKKLISNYLPLFIFRKLIKKSVNGCAKGSFLIITLMNLLGVSS